MTLIESTPSSEADLGAFQIIRKEDGHGETNHSY